MRLRRSLVVRPISMLVDERNVGDHIRRQSLRVIWAAVDCITIGCGRCAGGGEVICVSHGTRQDCLLVVWRRRLLQTLGQCFLVVWQEIVVISFLSDRWQCQQSSRKKRKNTTKIWFSPIRIRWMLAHFWHYNCKLCNWLTRRAEITGIT